MCKLRRPTPYTVAACSGVHSLWSFLLRSSFAGVHVPLTSTNEAPTLWQKKLENRTRFHHDFMARAPIAKPMVPLDSACQIGLSTFLREVLTVDQGACRWRFKNREFGNVFAFALSTSGRMGKWMIPLDSAHRIGVSTLSRKV